MKFVYAIFAIWLVTTMLAIGQTRPPFVAKGSRELVGRWGRNMNGIIHGGNEAAKGNYNEFVFDASGHFKRKGKHLGSSVNGSGIYRVDGKKLRLYFLEGIDDKGKRYKPGDPGPYECELTVESGWNTFRIMIATYQRGLYWDFKRNCYLDAETGKSVGGPGHKGNEVRFEAEQPPTAGSKQQCEHRMRSLFKALSGYGLAHAGEWPKRLTQSDFLSARERKVLTLCPRTGRTYIYNEQGTPFAISCPGCSQRI